MIFEKIKKDTSEEFLIIRDELNIFLENDFDIDKNKLFLSTHIPNEVLIKTDILLETLINYLMEDALNILKKSDTETQNLFYKEDLRRSIKNWSLQNENKLKLNPSTAEYSKDPRSFNGLIAGGITFVAGSAITAIYFEKESVLQTIVTGVFTLFLSAIAYKIAFNKSKNAARETIKQDIENYLKISESQTKEWLKEVINSFSKDFESFCSKNNFDYKGKII